MAACSIVISIGGFDGIDRVGAGRGDSGIEIESFLTVRDVKDAVAHEAGRCLPSRRQIPRHLSPWHMVWFPSVNWCPLMPGARRCRDLVDLFMASMQ